MGEVWRKHFVKLDTDGNGDLNFNELKVFVAELGWDDEIAAEAFRFLDKDDNGTIDFDEFLKWKKFAWHHKAHNSPKMKRISVRDSHPTISSLDSLTEDKEDDDDNDNEKLEETPDQDVEVWRKHFVKLDTDGNGDLNFDELKVFVAE